MPSAASITDRFAAAVRALSLEPGPLLLAVSGGADSMALLHLCHAGLAERALHCVHVDHGIAPESAEVASRVEVAAKSLGLPCVVERLGLGSSWTETLAREARHRRLHEARRRCGARYLMLAHHSDDQIETVLMRLLRGSGPAGLAGMSSIRGALVRPLLGFSHQELVGYCEARGIDWWEDPANRDLRHDRAWVREEILPRIEARFPEARSAIRRSAAGLAENRDGWDEILDLLPGLAPGRDRISVSVAADPLKGYSSAVRRMVLRALGRRAFAPLGSRRLDQVEALLTKGHTGRGIDLGEGRRAELAGGRLRIVRLGLEPLPPVSISGAKGSVVWGEWRFDWAPDRAPEAVPRVGWTSWVVPGAGLELRAWQPGDRIYPVGGVGRRLVVRCMQDVQIARSDRPRWPVVGRASGIIWVPGVCRSNLAVPGAGSNATRIDARRA